MKKKLFVKLGIFIMVIAALVGCSSTQASYPTKDIKFIVPYGAGGTTDLTVRALIDAIPSDAMPDANLLVSNVAGGSGLIGANEFVTSKADGYTLGVLNCDLLLNEVLGKTEITVDDYVPLVALQADPYAVIVKADAPYQTFEELIDYVLEHPGEVTIGDTGTGSVPHLAVQAIDKALGTSFKTVAYDSSGDSVVAVVSGEVDVTISHTSAATGQLNAGEVKILAVTSNERLSTYPDAPAIGELYEEAKDMKILSWIFAAARPGTDEESINYLQDVFSQAVDSDQFKESIKNFHMQEVKMNAQELQDFLSEQREYYQEILN